MIVPSLDAHLGYWLRFVSNHVSQRFSESLSQRDVTVAEWVVLRALYDHDHTVPSEIAARLNLTRGAISKLMDRLAGKALVQIAPAAGDKRFQQIALTPAGRALVPDLAALADANDAAFFGHLTAEQRAALEVLLRDIVRRQGLNAIPLS